MLSAREIPEDANKQLQSDVLDVAVKRLLPGSPASSALIQVCAGAQVSKVQLRMQLEALDTRRKKTRSQRLSTAP
jgi:hypothetical protein